MNINKTALLALSLGSKTISVSSAFTSSSSYFTSRTLSRSSLSINFPLQQLHMSSSSSSSPPEIKMINKTQMNELIQIVEEDEDKESNIIIIDVRGHDEIAYTGKLSPVVHTLPLPYIVQNGILNPSTNENEEGEVDYDFEEMFGFSKPELDQTLVFTCKAGIRSMHAAQFAIQAGYTNVVNYMGGADEWFR